MNGLPALAQSVQSQGRGNDSMLVHMTPREVGGLQALAMANGGSLTINPQTGLPEAGFLDNILPMIAGAALTIGSGGVIDPFTASMIVGGGTAVVTGDVEKGFQAGLGAYGGAGLGSGLTAAGTVANAAPAAAPGTLAVNATPVVSQAATAATPATVTLPGGGAEQATTSLLDSFKGPLPPGVTPPVAAGTGTSVGTATMPASATAGLKSGASYGTSSAPTMDYNFSRAGEGFKALAGPEGRAAFMSEAGVGGLTGLAKYGGAAALPLLSSDAQGAPAGAPQNIRPYEYDPGRQDVAYRTGAPTESSAEQRYFDPRFKPMPIYRAKDGGSVPMLEDGGFVMTKKAVDGLGGGSNKKGQEELKKGLGAIALKGPGARRGPKAGKDDKIKTSIEGKIPARVSHGEAYVTKKGVKKAGGTTNMYELMRRAARKA